MTLAMRLRSQRRTPPAVTNKTLAKLVAAGAYTFAEAIDVRGSLSRALKPRKLNGS
jgi:hypothetical protein